MNNPFSMAGPVAGDIAMLQAELRAGLERFWQAAATILDGSTIQLVAPDEAAFSLPRNFFSTLFLYSYYRLGIPPERRILYVALNQCLRGMVTGCDNILDDEYKTTMETDLPPQAHRFRSVLDIMVADRVLFALVVEHCQRHGLPMERVLQASTASLAALTQSGAQEAAEEGGVGECLRPEVILQKIHHYKTGRLFQAPWAIPAFFEEATTPAAQAAREALYHIGIGCQILDDLADLFLDMRGKRHNYVASVIAHGEGAAVWQSLQSLVVAGATPESFFAAWPELAARLKAEAMGRLESGLSNLFLARHHDFVGPAAAFIAARIGVVVP